MQGYIIKGIGGFYYIKTENEIVEAKPKGLFRNMGISPLAGDIVQLTKYDDSYVITEILPRKNSLVRPPVANVDILFIVVSTISPKPSTLIIDTLAGVATAKGIEPVLIITKTDLAVAKELQQSYKTSKINIIEISENEKSLQPIKELLNGKVTVFTGNSGVGKSTLLNRLDKTLKLETDIISVKLGRGKHTTRSAELYPICGGLVADTAGFSSLELSRLADITKEQLQDAFLDVAQYKSGCKFADCSHLKEPSCAVIQAVAQGDISPTRYASYVALFKEICDKKEY